MTTATGRTSSSHELRVLERALRVLGCFSEQEPRWRLSELAQAVELDKTVVFRILHALASHSLVHLDEATGRYCLTPSFLRWAYAVPGFTVLRQLALPEMQSLREASGETVFLSMMDGDARISVLQSESPQEVRRTIRLGERLPLVYGATGKAALAFLGEERIRSLLAETQLTRHAPGTIVDPAELLADLAKVRQRGYATSIQGLVEGAAAMAAPIFDHEAQVVAILTVTGPASRFGPPEMERLGDRLVKAARIVSRGIGHVSMGIDE